MKISRVYIGDQFCHNLVPNYEMIKRLVKLAYKEKLNITIALPYIVEGYVDELREVLKFLSSFSEEQSCKIEVIVNDLAVLSMIQTKYKNLVPVWGILLNKKKKDPRTKYWFGYKKLSNKLNINNINSYLKDNGIKRIEYESNVKENDIYNGIGGSIHIPYYQINTSTFCRMYAQSTNNKPNLVTVCPQYCNEFCFMYPKHLKMIGRGNSIFGIDSSILSNLDKFKSCIEKGINRLVITL